MRRTTSALLTVSLLALGACGGEDASDPAASSSETSEESPSPTEAPFASDPEEDAAMEGCQKGPEAKTKIEVSQIDFLFKPAKIKAPAGEMVTLVVTNKGSVEHTFTSDELDCDSGYVAADTKQTVTFKMPDKPVDFYCIPHESAMTGTIVPT